MTRRSPARRRPDQRPGRGHFRLPFDQQARPRLHPHRHAAGAESVNSQPFDITPAPLTWTGQGDGLNWSDPKNWDLDVVPSNGDSLIFPSGLPPTTSNDLSGLSLGTIDLTGAGYDLTGNAITLTGGLTSEAGNNTYDIDTTLSRPRTFDDATGDLTIQSLLSGTGGLTADGAGALTLDQGDSYSVLTTLDAGVTIDDVALSPQRSARAR